jgi:hypothetical protein
LSYAQPLKEVPSRGLSQQREREREVWLNITRAHGEVKTKQKYYSEAHKCVQAELAFTELEII